MARCRRNNFGGYHRRPVLGGPYVLPDSAERREGGVGGVRDSDPDLSADGGRRRDIAAPGIVSVGAKAKFQTFRLIQIHLRQFA